MADKRKITGEGATEIPFSMLTEQKDYSFSDVQTMLGESERRREYQKWRSERLNPRQVAKRTIAKVRARKGRVRKALQTKQQGPTVVIKY